MKVLTMAELNFLVLQQLLHSGISENALQMLEAEMVHKDLLPQNFDWQKNRRNSFKELVIDIKRIINCTREKVIHILHQIIFRSSYNSFYYYHMRNFPSKFLAGRFSEGELHYLSF